MWILPLCGIIDIRSRPGGVPFQPTDRGGRVWRERNAALLMLRTPLLIGGTSGASWGVDKASPLSTHAVLGELNSPSACARCTRPRRSPFMWNRKSMKTGALLTPGAFHT